MKAGNGEGGSMKKLAITALLLVALVPLSPARRPQPRAAPTSSSVSDVNVHTAQFPGRAPRSGRRGRATRSSLLPKEPGDDDGRRVPVRLLEPPSQGQGTTATPGGVPRPSRTGCGSTALTLPRVRWRQPD